MGPYEIHRETQGGSYRLKELNGVHLENAIATYRLILYITRQRLSQWHRMMDKRRLLQRRPGRRRLQAPREAAKDDTETEPI